jgi:hypothetical protein
MRGDQDACIPKCPGTDIGNWDYGVTESIPRPDKAIGMKNGYLYEEVSPVGQRPEQPHRHHHVQTVRGDTEHPCAWMVLVELLEFEHLV